VIRKLAREFRELPLEDVVRLLHEPWHEARLLAVILLADAYELATRPRALLDTLAQSKNIWERRIAVVTTQRLIRNGEFDDTVRLATALLGDQHDLIHKAVGWMLREVGDRDSAVLDKFLEAHAHEMPRTMLRYAIEKMGAAKKRRYMEARAARAKRG
jgi:3-methyladenine DNA glycosylase AlkD